jgi:ATP-dependent Zn protease
VIDAEVRRIVEECLREADRLLAENRHKLDALARALLKAESLNAKEILDVTSDDLPGESKVYSPVPLGTNRSDVPFVQ